MTEDGAKENAVGVISGEKSPPQRPVFNPRKAFSRGTSEAPPPSQGDGSVSGVTPHRFSAKHHRSGDPIRTGSTTATPAYVPTVPSVASGVAPRVSTSPSGQVAPSGWNQRKRPSARESS
ncbi:hypothetical protein J437_LFUL001483 [Ladona fulva]|uniref:Uncharacterized protein n=1 Tax=Ladona fulva TaxID=123851 RepID=A0A8K0JWN3_LADFU|nr:hypothetical protein J437_LFUL001483 [Ladona fulva]